MDTKIKQQITESLQTGTHLGQLLCADLLADRPFTAEELHGRFMQVSQPIAAAQAMADTLLPAPIVELAAEEIPAQPGEETPATPVVDTVADPSPEAQ